MTKPIYPSGSGSKRNFKVIRDTTITFRDSRVFKITIHSSLYVNNNLEANSLKSQPPDYFENYQMLKSIRNSKLQQVTTIAIAVILGQMRIFVNLFTESARVECV